MPQLCSGQHFPHTCSMQVSWCRVACRVCVAGAMHQKHSLPKKKPHSGWILKTKCKNHPGVHCFRAVILRRTHTGGGFCKECFWCVNEGGVFSASGECFLCVNEGGVFSAWGECFLAHAILSGFRRRIRHPGAWHQDWTPGKRKGKCGVSNKQDRIGFIMSTVEHPGSWEQREDEILRTAS